MIRTALDTGCLNVIINPILKALDSLYEIGKISLLTSTVLEKEQRKINIMKIKITLKGNII
jgi:hypothetical protein